MKSAGKTTIYDIAALCSASPSTVSAALNGTWKARRLREETVRGIQRVAAEQGYATNRQARGLRKAESGLIALVLPVHDNRFFSALSQAFSAEARTRGLCPVIVSTNRDPVEEANVVGNLLGYAVEALFIAGATRPEALSTICRDARLPHVFLDQPCERGRSVVSDNYRGAARLTEKILDDMPAEETSERARIHFLGGDASRHATARRIAGFRATVTARRSGLDDTQIIACGYDASRSATALEALCQRLGALPAGLLINSVTCFEGALRYLVGLPVAAFDTTTFGLYDYDPFGAFFPFELHMVRQDSEALVARAFELIGTGSDEPVLDMVPPDLVPPRTVHERSSR